MTSRTVGGMIDTDQESPENAVFKPESIFDIHVEKSGKILLKTAFIGIQISCMIDIIIVKRKLKNAVISFPIIKSHPIHHRNSFPLKPLDQFSYTNA